MQRGLSRYTRAWGPRYKALSGHEQAILIRDGRVEQAFERLGSNRALCFPLNTPTWWWPVAASRYRSTGRSGSDLQREQSMPHWATWPTWWGEAPC